MYFFAPSLSFVLSIQPEEQAHLFQADATKPDMKAMSVQTDNVHSEQGVHSTKGLAILKRRVGIHSVCVHSY